MTFDEWLNEIENFSLRSERLYDDFMEVKDLAKLRLWLEAAYKVGYEAGFANFKGFEDIEDDEEL